VERGKSWWEQPQLLVHAPPLKEVMDTMAQMIPQDTAPDPEGGPGGRRITKPVAPDRRISLEDPALRHGRKSRAKTCNGFQEHLVVDLDSTVIREGVVRPANEPEHAAVDLLAPEVENPPGLLQRDIDLGDMASPRKGQWAERGVYILARPWPGGGSLCTKHDFPFDCAHGRVTCPGGQTVPMLPGRAVQCPASACDACPQRAQCTTAKLGQGRPLTSREDEPFQQPLRAKRRTQRGRAALRKRTAVDHAISHQ
jgi:hypothetical protein